MTRRDRAVAIVALVAGVTLGLATGVGRPRATADARALVPGWAPCGTERCDARTSYCEIVLSDAPEIPTDTACRALPAACRGSEAAPASCDCLAPALEGQPAFCGRIVTGGLPALHVTWQGVKRPRPLKFR